jgi:glycosyltransferase involved in cell wall biosynthesis
MPLTMISVIICTRNRAAILRDCLLSLAGQELANLDYEIIVVDDGSTDDTGDAVQRVRDETGKGIKYVRQDHSGLNTARNRGIREAGGDVVLFFDDDEMAPPGYIIKVANALNTDPELDGVGGPYKDYREKGLRTCSRCSLAAHTVDRAEDGSVTRLLGGNMALRKSLFSEVGMFDKAVSLMGSARGDESEWFHRARGRKFKFDESIWIWHRRDHMDLRSLLSHSFMQGSFIPLCAQKTGQGYRPSLIKLLKHLRHAVLFMCAQGLVLAARESGAIWASIKKKDIS